MMMRNEDDDDDDMPKLRGKCIRSAMGFVVKIVVCSHQKNNWDCEWRR